MGEVETIAQDLSNINFDENLSDGQQYKHVAVFGDTDDSRLQYEFVKKDVIEQKDLSEVVASDNIDYLVPRDEEAIKKGHHCDLPLSFLSIKEGQVEMGKEWYLMNYPKLPDEMAELLARYNWGDMKFMTKKSVKNSRKKYEKKHHKKKDIKEEGMFQKKHGSFLVEFK
tara:strand:+ start:4551 stop:5057 length:507 start_codon:yes stop_codon:yes gene_type:complete